MRFMQPITRLYADVTDRGKRGAMMRSAGNTAGLQVASTLVSFGSSLLYARVLGPHGYGLYAYVIAWTTILAIPVALGVPTYLMREGAGRPGTTRALLHWADLRVAAAGLLAAVLLAAVWFVPRAGETRWLFVIAALIPLGTALGHVRQALLRSLHRVASSQWPLVLGPCVLLVTMFSLWLARGSLRAWEVTAAALVATFLITAIGHVQLRSATREADPIPRPALSLRTGLPFMVLGMLFLINSRLDIIMLGTLRGPAAAGIYAVVSRGAAFVTLLAAAANLVLAPRIADLHRMGSHELMQRMVTASAVRVLLLSLPLAAVLIAAADVLLSVLYGGVYAAGASALRILVLGHLTTVVTSVTSTVANMTGHERLTLYSVGVSVSVNFLLDLALIPAFGIDGAAIATSVSLALFNGMQWYWVRTRVGVRPTAFGI